MNQYLIAAVVALGLALSGALWAVSELRDSRAAMVVSLNEAKEDLAASQARTNEIQVQVQREKTRADANRSLLRNALKENEKWAAGAVPPAVADSLCRKPAVCSRDPASVPRAAD
jgi:hypothetical protein